MTATALVDDLPRIWKRVPSERQILLASRLAVAAGAGAVAMDPDSQVLGLVAYAWAGLGASFGPAPRFTLFWRRTTANGLIAGMMVGAATVVGWRGLEGGVFDLYEPLPAFLAACLAIWVVSRVESADPASERARPPVTARAVRSAGGWGRRCPRVARRPAAPDPARGRRSSQARRREARTRPARRLPRGP